MRTTAVMTLASLSARERQREARWIELEKCHRSTPGLTTALARAEVGKRIDELCKQTVLLQEQFDAGPAETLQDTAMKLRRPGAYGGGAQAREAAFWCLGGGGECGGVTSGPDSPTAGRLLDDEQLAIHDGDGLVARQILLFIGFESDRTG